MAYYDALASSAPSKKKPNKNRPNRLRFVVGGKKFVLFSSFLLDIEFAVLFRERVLVQPGIKNAFVVTLAKFNHATGWAETSKIRCLHL